MVKSSQPYYIARPRNQLHRKTKTTLINIVVVAESCMSDHTLIPSIFILMCIREMSIRATFTYLHHVLYLKYVFSPLVTIEEIVINSPIGNIFCLVPSNFFAFYKRLLCHQSNDHAQSKNILLLCSCPLGYTSGDGKIISSHFSSHLDQNYLENNLVY